MTREEVIKGLELCTQPGSDCAADCPYINARHAWMTCTDVLMTDALALLKEQEARNALNIVKVHEGTLGNCPTCGAELIDYYNETHCGRCGQAVKWE